MRPSKSEALRESVTFFTHAALVWSVCAACAADATMRPPKTVPPTPAGVTAAALASEIVNITWKDESPNERHFRVERAPSPVGPWATAMTTDANVTATRDRGVASEQQYCYRVTAASDVGDSAPSAAACVVPPAAPSRLMTTLTAGPQVMLSWVSHSASATGYEILRATDSAMLSRVGTMGVGETYTDRDVVEGQTYYYEVQAVNSSGVSGGSNISTIVVTRLGSRP